MLVGAVHGYRALIAGLIRQLKSQLKTNRLPVIATGGYAKLISSGLREITAIDPLLTFLVSYGHLLIGLSLLFGLMVRVSAAFGVALLLMYWTAHMDWPFIENTNNLIVDYHLVYAGVLVYLIVKRAGHVFGLDGWAENLNFFKQHPTLKPLVA